MDIRCEEHKLGKSLSFNDSLLDGITFQMLVDAVYSNCDVIDPAVVRKTLDEMVQEQLRDMYFLLEKNMVEIVRAARQNKGVKEC